MDLTSGASVLLAWFPASWASKIALRFLANATENAQKLQEINITCPKRSPDEIPMEGEKQTLQAVKFAAKNMPGLHLALEEDFESAGCFEELMHGYAMGLVEPYMMRGLQPLGPNRTTLEVIILSQAGLTPEKWKKTATLCPLDWPSTHSLLRLWHTNGSLYQTEARLREQLSFLWSAPVAFRRVALETPAWTSRDSNHHRQSVSAGKTNAIPTEPSGRLTQGAAVAQPHGC